MTPENRSGMESLKNLTKIESIAAGLILGILCPLSTFVLCWWAAAALNFYIPIPERWIAAAALVGLAAGFGLNVLYLKRWILSFYQVDMKLLILVYLFCSAMATAFFMGLPFGNLVLGTLAGVYMGRRALHAPLSRVTFSNTASRVGNFAALATGAWALWIGLLALNDESTTASLQAVSGVAWEFFAGPAGIGLVIVLCIILMAVQYWCARAAAWIAFRLG
jgi:hypothetical protein